MQKQTEQFISQEFPDSIMNKAQQSGMLIINIGLDHGIQNLFGELEICAELQMSLTQLNNKGYLVKNGTLRIILLFMILPFKMRRILWEHV